MSPADLQRELDQLIGRNEAARILNRSWATLKSARYDKWLAPVFRIGAQGERFYRRDVVERLALGLQPRYRDGRGRYRHDPLVTPTTCPPGHDRELARMWSRRSSTRGTARRRFPQHKLDDIRDEFVDAADRAKKKGDRGDG